MAKGQQGNGKGQDSTGIVRNASFDVKYELQGAGKKATTLQCPDIIGKFKEDALKIAKGHAETALGNLHPKRRVTRIRISL
ncbi:MAG: hypothetical protein QMD77_02230 [Patescibacteria group bacterium]|nr:hypothetical protein [Patescibacteria group bacterium]